MCILGDDLFDGELSSTFNVFSEPNKTEASSSEEFDFFKTVRKAVTKSLFFLLG